MNTIRTIDPFADFFPHLFRGAGQPLRARTATVNRNPSMPIDVAETESGFVVRAEIPGVDKEQIKVEVDGDEVSITAQVKRNVEQKEGERLVRNERYQGRVSRTLSFGSELSKDNAVASYENGVLELTLPKSQVADAKRLTIA